PYVDRGHTRGAALQQDIGEAARRCADVEAVTTAWIHSERIERVRELLAATRHVRRRRLELELSRVVDLRSRLRMAAHSPREHECLRLRARLREPALDEQDVEPFLHARRSAQPEPRRSTTGRTARRECSTRA